MTEIKTGFGDRIEVLPEPAGCVRLVCHRADHAAFGTVLTQNKAAELVEALLSGGVA